MQILETWMYDDTNSISNGSIEPKSFMNFNWLSTNLNLNNSKFYVPSDPNLIHKPQSTNPDNKHVRPSTSYFIPKNLNSQVETNMNLVVSSRLILSTLQTKNPNIIVKPQTGFKQKVQFKHIANPATVLLLREKRQFI